MRVNTIQFLELAQSELDDVFEAYEYKEEDLGYAFGKEVSATLNLIKTYPHVGSKSSNHTQRFLLKGFPYAILYQKVGAIVLVVALVNLHKKPIHWVSKSVSEYSTSRIAILPETIYTR